MKLLLTLFISVALLSACGGGSSSSESSANNTATSGGAGTNFDGVYNGTQVIRFTALGVSSSITAPITLTIQNGNIVTIQGEPAGNLPINAQGEFSGTDTNSANISDGSIQECTATGTTSGRVSGSQISGTTEGSGTCLIDGRREAITVITTFDAMR